MTDKYKEKWEKALKLQLEVQTVEDTIKTLSKELLNIKHKISVSKGLLTVRRKNLAKFLSE